MRFHLAVCLLAATLPAAGQNVRAEPEEDPVQAAIREFNLRDRSKPNEVTVVLDAPDEVPPKAAVLVTGTPPDEAELVNPEENEPAGHEDEPPSPAADEPDKDSADTAEPAAEELAEPEPSAPEKGLSVRVEKLQTGAGRIDPAQVKIAAPFPAKPISRPPAGWKVMDSEQAPELTREVELAPGSTITLTVRPHVLVPDDDGSTVFSVAEPGFDNSLGYAQDATVGAILSQSLLRMDEDSKRLGSVVDHLQQLLVSLPKPEAPDSSANPNPRKP